MTGNQFSDSDPYDHRRLVAVSKGTPRSTDPPIYPGDKPVKVITWRDLEEGPRENVDTK
ncbi:MAG: hypothetical protein WC505_01290 [Patescibacteria group bacterium]